MEKQYKIYKLILEGEVVYIGQTTQSLKTRKSGHHKDKTFERVKESIIELIEITTDKSRERFWIDYYLNQGCILFNKNKGCGYNKKEHNKKYKEENKEKILSEAKKYYEDNKEEVLKKKKKYYEDNKKEIIEKNKLRYQLKKLQQTEDSI
jgi:hypothetical protein